MNARLIEQLAPTGVLRAGVNLSNFLLVTGRSDNGDPVGVSPDMAGEIARRLAVPVQYVTYKSPGLLADAAQANEWDIGLIGAEPQRAEKIVFTTAYVEIEATYLVPDGSPIESIDEVDRPGVRIAVAGRAAYGLWLARNIKHATLVTTDSLDESLERFVADGCEVLAGLRPRLLQDQQKISGSRILDGKFSAVQQAIGTQRGKDDAATFLQDFVNEAIRSGFVTGLIEKHRVNGLSVATQS